MNINFNDLPWHDAVLQSIYIDRRNPGERDVVQFLIEWPSGDLATIEFYDCYSLNMNMNFGVIAYESVLSAECLADSKEINVIQNEWLKMGANLDQLKCFTINTNSTNSTINIFALGFRIESGSSLM